MENVLALFINQVHVFAYIVIIVIVINIIKYSAY